MRPYFFYGYYLPWIRRLSAWLFAPAFLVVAWGELWPHPPSLPGPWSWDKADHFTAYFGLALLATLGWGLRRSLFGIFLVVVALSGTLELLQYAVGREPELMDMVANIAGAVIGTATGAGYLAVPRKLSPTSKQSTEGGDASGQARD